MPTNGRLDQKETGRRGTFVGSVLYNGTINATEQVSQPSFDLAAFLSCADGRTTTVVYKKGEAAFWQGDDADDVFYILDGNFKVAILSARGKEAVIALPRKGDFFGEGCLEGHARRIATVSTITRARVLKISRATMVGLLLNEAEFAGFFLSYLLNRNARVESDLVDHLFNSSERRLARLLLLMANYGEEGETEAVIPNISQGTLAEMIGTTRSRVNVFMNKFRRLGFIEYRGGLKIHRSLLKVVLHDDPSMWS